MSRRPYAGKKFKPRRANGAKGLIFKRVWRCEKCGLQHEKKPLQCHCGGMAFIKFDSKAEANRYATLLLYVDHGKITDLRRQVRIPLNTKGPDGLAVTIGHLVADFDYNDVDGKRVIEDVKGLITDLASWKIRHVKAQYGIEVLITH